MFEPLKPLFGELGYEAVVVYITDDYPDRMQIACSHGDAGFFPPAIALVDEKNLYDELLQLVPAPTDTTNFLTAQLFSHGRELGAIAAITREGKSGESEAAFDALAKSVSVMAYVERIRTNGRRERIERDVFFAQSLANRLLPRRPPEMKNLRIGFECVRSLEAGGEFLDLIPEPNGVLFGFLGSCSGRGARTVLEVAGIMRAINHACHAHPENDLASVMQAVNTHLVREKRRAYQASLALFRVDPKRHKLTVVKSGCVGMLLCGGNRGIIGGGHDAEIIRDISSSGSMFLGMADTPDFHVDEYDFPPGQGFFCMTECVFPREFRDSVRTAWEQKKRKPLVTTTFDLSGRTDDPMIALSIESDEGRNQASVRMSARRIAGA
jgi:serine phosphatase RsbU (regulator of sigma subunit)